jgi:uncharacterized protein with HEPN domain
VKHDHVYLHHVREAIDRILRYTRGGRDAFIGDTMLQDAVVRNIEVMGEAIKQLSPAYRNAHPEVAWKSIAGMRDRLIHGYDQVDLALVWDVVERHIPDLQAKVEVLVRALPPPPTPQPPIPPPPAPPPP